MAKLPKPLKYDADGKPSKAGNIRGKNTPFVKGNKCGKQFAPGTSGNPAGRPKRGETYREIISYLGTLTRDEIAAELAAAGTEWTWKKRQMYNLMLAAENDASIMLRLIDSVEGSAKQTVEHTVLQKAVEEMTDEELLMAKKALNECQ